MCNISLGYVGVQIWNTEMVDGHGEDQVETGRVDGLGAVTWGLDQATKMAGRLTVVADTCKST